MKLLISFASGALFGAGLLISGMYDPKVVLGFLDVFGDWNPALAFVMGGGLLVTVLGFRWMNAKGNALPAPNTQGITRPLVMGAILFGIGWGLVGYCPGPALLSAFAQVTSALYFVAAMVVGMLLHKMLSR